MSEPARLNEPAAADARPRSARLGASLAPRDPPATAARPVAITWRETLVLAVVGGLALGVMTLPAFGTFFVGEAFLYLGQFQAAGGDYARALLSPTDVVWFRPVFFSLSLPWYFILPLDPWAYHPRNALLCVVNLVLLHRLLGHLVAHRVPRVLAVLLFAVSKVHLTTIGYLIIFDSIVMLTLLLTTLLCFLRFIERRRWLDYALGLVACCLAVWAKEYGAVAVLVVLALVATHGLTRPLTATRLRWWAVRLAPLPVMVLAYLGLRAAIVAPLTSASPLYTPGLSLNDAALKAYLFVSAFTNASLSQSGTVGAPGWGSLLAAVMPGLGARAAWIDLLPLVGGPALLLATLVMVRRHARVLLWPVVLIAVYYAPAFLTRNIQIYYTHESLAGLALLVGLCLDRADRRLTRAWVLAVAVFAVGGLVSNHASWYWWQRSADAARQVNERVLPSLRGTRLDTLTFAAREPGFWQWSLSADEKAPMIPLLLGQPGPRVRVIDHQALPAAIERADPTNPVVAIDEDFAIYPPR